MKQIQELVEENLNENVQNAMKMFTLAYTLLTKEVIENIFEEGKEKEEKEEKRKEKTQPQGGSNIPPQGPDVEIPFPPSPEDPAYFIKIIADGWNISFKNTMYVLKALNQNHTGALLNLLLGTIAKEIDLSYSGHIKDCEYIYTFNPMDAKIYKQYAKDIKPIAFKYFAAFRSKEDAIFAIQMVSHIKKFVMRYTNEQKD